MRDTRADDVKKEYSDYAESTYGGTLDRITSIDAVDLETPFERTGW